MSQSQFTPTGAGDTRVAGQPRVYLAGPMVFYPDPLSIFAVMKRICRGYGVEGVAPLDGQVSLAGMPPGRALIRRIVEADIALMRKADAGVFCLDGFRRGPEMDPGTAFELGFMQALGKPLTGWTADPRDYQARVAGYFRDVFGQNLRPPAVAGSGAASGTLRDPDGMLVHSEYCYQNAMTQHGIELSGGKVFAADEWKHAFDAAVSHLAKRLIATE